MFKEFLTFLNCCKKKKGEDPNELDNSDYESDNKNLKNKKEIAIEMGPQEKIDIDGNLEYELLIREKEG